jgi:hypothetical protein
MVGLDLEEADFDELKYFPDIFFPEDELRLLLVQLSNLRALFPHGMEPNDSIIQNSCTNDQIQFMKLPHFPLSLSVTFDIRANQCIEQKQAVIEAELIAFGDCFGNMIEFLADNQVNLFHIVQVLEMRDGDLNDGLFTWVG